MLDPLRNAVPLSWRRQFGPYLGYITYWWRTRVRGNTWEPRVLSTLETLEMIKDEKLSVIRFGDGELSLISGINLGFQPYSSTLAAKLREVLQSNEPGLLIGIPNIFGRLEHFVPLSFWFEIHHIFRYGRLWQSLTESDRLYGDAFITRPYLGYKDKREVAKIYDLVKSLWGGYDHVALIEGAQSRIGVGNDLFANIADLKRILCPAEDAFARAEEIIRAASLLPKDTLILLSLGPAAKVIGYELFRRGYRILDIGHIDMEYEMFLRQATKQTAVPYKYFNEIDARDPEDCRDPLYLSQIVARIT